jgi:CRISPR/Cas system-associated protein Cas10 (large subunit of type III CRISPR-Cas system)
MVTRSIGDGLISTGFRSYISGKGILVTWVQRRCEVCGRFLKKRQERFCDIHGTHNEIVKKWNKENRTLCSQREKIYRKK